MQITLLEQMNEPLVSIIIPCFNREKYLPETIASCLGQTYGSIELIIIDDGSTDRTWDIIKKSMRNNPQIKAIRTTNQGQCSARNLGIKLAKGRYVKFLDSDDLLLPHSINYQVQILRHFQVDVTVGGVKLFRDRELISVHENLMADVSFSNSILYQSFLELILNQRFTFNEILISKSLVDNVEGFYSYLKGAEELNLCLKLAAIYPKSKIAFSEEVVLMKRIGCYSLAYDLRQQKPNPWLLLSLEHAGKYCLEQKKSLNTELKNYVFNRLYISMTYAYRNGFVGKALVAYSTWKLAKIKPPVLKPWYHHILHHRLGFLWAEKILSIMRIFISKIRAIFIYKTKSIQQK